MLIKNKEDFEKALELSHLIYSLYYPYEKSREPNKCFVFKYNEKIYQVLGNSNTFSSNLSGGTIQNIEKAEWFEASKEEKDRINKMIKDKEHKDKIFSGKYNVYEKIDEKEYKEVSEFIIKYSGMGDYDFNELILVKKENDK